MLEQHPDIQRIYLEDQLIKLQEGVNTRLFRRSPMPDQQRAKVKEFNDRMFMLINDLNKIVP